MAFLPIYSAADPEVEPPADCYINPDRVVDVLQNHSGVVFVYDSEGGEHIVSPGLRKTIIALVTPQFLVVQDGPTQSGIPATQHTRWVNPRHITSVTRIPHGSLVIKTILGSNHEFKVYESCWEAVLDRLGLPQSLGA